MRHVIAGTAGHIDHGKTRLVLALTGVDCDRLSEEKERGITIDIGFAPLRLADDLHVGFVDVPGHERFLKNMLAGASGIDLVVLVVASDESVKPQTREHLDVCRLLGVRTGLVALTKADLADEETRELVTLEVKELVKGSFLEASPVVPVSAVTGEGLGDLRRLLEAAAREVRPRSSTAFFRLPVDRAFSMRGFGTVVTGTLASGSIREGDPVEILPSGRHARVRGLQVHGESRKEALAGQRTALNLQGIDVGEAGRGVVLAPPGAMQPSSMLDVRIQVLGTARGPLKDLSRVRFHQGTSEVLARVKLLQEGPIQPGREGFAQLRLERPGATLPGDRFVLRLYSPMVTVGGGVVLDAHPDKHRGRSSREGERLGHLGDGDPESLLLDLLDRMPGGLPRAEVQRRTGLAVSEAERLSGALSDSGRAVAVGGRDGFLLAAAHHERLRAGAQEILRKFHLEHPLALGMPREELLRRLLPSGEAAVGRFILERLAGEGKIRLEKEVAAAASHEVALGPDEQRISAQLESRFQGSGLNPPTLEEVVRDLGLDPPKAHRIYHLLLSRGSLVRIKDGRVFHTGAIERLKTLLWELRERQPVIDVAAFKELTGTTRKNAIPLLEHMDAERVTRRRQNDREILPRPGARP